MRRTPLVLGAALALAAATAAAARSRAAEPPYRITALRAQLFYSDRGTLSADVLASPGKSLWNTPIGEGEAGGPSDATLVVVEVAGAPGSYEPDRSVELTATAEGKVVLRRATEMSVLNRRGRMYAGFWLYGTGCKRVRLSARMRGQTPASEMKKEIPFDCGE